MSNRIRIRVGDIEIEYDGPQTFERDDLLRLVTSISSITHGTRQSADTSEVSHSARVSVGTTAAIAAKLNAKTARDLVLASAYRLNVGEGQASFSRAELIREMRSATQYFKQTYIKNLSKTLHTMLKAGELNEPSNARYCLSAKKRAELEKTLAD